MTSILDCAIDNLTEKLYSIKFNFFSFITKPRNLYRFTDGSYWVQCSHYRTDFRSAYTDEVGRWVLGNSTRHITGSVYNYSDFTKV